MNHLIVHGNGNCDYTYEEELRLPEIKTIPVKNFSLLYNYWK